LIIDSWIELEIPILPILALSEGMPVPMMSCLFI